MISINISTLVGHLGKTPVLKKTNNGKSFCFLSLATKKVYYAKDANGQPVKKERSDWHNIKVWGKHAENCCKFLKQGQQVGIEGEHRNDLVKGQNGQPDRWFQYINAYKVDFGYESRKSQQGATQQPVPQAAPTNNNLDPKMWAMFQQFLKMANVQSATTQAAPPEEMVPPFMEDDDDSGYVPPEMVERTVQPPVQPVLKAGL